MTQNEDILQRLRLHEEQAQQLQRERQEMLEAAEERYLRTIATEVVQHHFGYVTDELVEEAMEQAQRLLPSVKNVMEEHQRGTQDAMTQQQRVPTTGTVHSYDKAWKQAQIIGTGKDTLVGLYDIFIVTHPRLVDGGEVHFYVEPNEEGKHLNVGNAAFWFIPDEEE